MGSPKQLLPWGNTTIIEHQINVLKSLTKNVIVVLGAHQESICHVVEKYDVRVVLNENWEKGMGTSISKGIREIITWQGAADGVLIALVDQPLVNLEHYSNLVAAFDIGEGSIVVSHASTGWEGVPVVFDSCYFGELSVLEGDSGAKGIINSYRENVRSVGCDHILDDIDTPEKYLAMLSAYKKLLS
jgi:molybdenum cofactor cytidylyltransferase